LAFSLVAQASFAQAADNYYFRLRPSVSILNQEPFSVHILGDNAGVVGTTFNAKAEASSPRETLRFSVSDGNLPPGVTLDAASGSITGQPKLKGLFRATVTAEDAFSTASAPLEVQVYDSLEIESLISQYATVGVQYSSTFKGLGGNQDYNWSLSGTPPTGLSLGGLSSATSILGGVPTTPGQWSDLRVNLSDSAGHSTSTAPFSVTVADPLKISGNPATVATVGQSYSASFTSNGGHAPISWLLSSGALPKGLSFSNGTISGTPEEPGTSAGLVVQATDVASNKATSAPFSIAVSQPLSIAGAPSNIATVGVSYSGVFTAAGGNGNYSWSVKSGQIPDGMKFANGEITGAPTSIGTWPDIVIGVADGDGRSAQSSPFSIVVSDPLAIAGSPSPVATVGANYSAVFAATGGDGNYNWVVRSGTLPQGLSLADGKITGVPTTAVSSTNIVIGVTDGNGRTANSPPFSIVVSNPLTVAGTPAPIATVGTSYSATFTASGGAGGNSWTVVSGSLPTGLSLASGSITGSPSAAGTWSNIVVRVTDKDGRTADSTPFSIVVSDQLTLAGNPASIATVGAAYSATFTTSGGAGGNTWALVSGFLPTGLSLSNGTISGSPTASGIWANLVVQVKDKDGRTAQSAVFSIVVSDTLTLAGSPTPFATVNAPYSFIFTTSGGAGGNTWAVVSGSLPNGINLSGGTISGTPTTAGTWANIVIRVTDTNGRTAQTPAFSITVSPLLTIAGSASPVATVGTGYSASFAASGGAGGNTWTVASGSLPNGLALLNGVISGTPSAAGTWSNIVIRVTDKDGRTAQSGAFSIVVSNQISISGSSPWIGTVGTGYSGQFYAAGGTGSYSWAIVSGSLPSGLWFSNGTIGGTPSGAGTWSNIIVRVMDTNGRIADSGPFSIVVSDVLNIYGGAPATGTVGQGYSAVFWSGGGGGGNSWAIVSGSLPNGLWFSNGTIGGTPSAAGTWSNIIVRVTDANGRVAQSGPFSIRISNPVSISGSSPWQGTVGWGYGGQFYAGGGTGSYGWGIVSGSLPDGLWLNGNGTIGGTPSRSGVWGNIVVRVWDNEGRYADSGAFNIYIYDQMSMGGNAGGNGKVGQYFQTSVAAYGGRGPYGWGIVAGGLPPGMGFSNGTVYGTPSSAGTWYFIIRAWDQDGRSVDSPTFAISVAPNIVHEGEYYDSNGTAWVEFAGTTSISWFGTSVGSFGTGPGAVTIGNATYYRGSLRFIGFYGYLLYYGISRDVQY